MRSASSWSRSAGPTARVPPRATTAFYRAVPGRRPRRRRLHRLRHAAWRDAPEAEQAAVAGALHREVIAPAMQRARARAGALAPARPATWWPSSPRPTSSSRGRSPRCFGVDALIATELERDAGGRVTGGSAACRPSAKARSRACSSGWRGRAAPRGLRAQHLLQRLDQRPAAARTRQRPGGDQPSAGAGTIARERGWPILQPL